VGEAIEFRNISQDLLHRKEKKIEMKVISQCLNSLTDLLFSSRKSSNNV